MSIRVTRRRVPQESAAIRPAFRGPLFPVRQGQGVTLYAEPLGGLAVILEMAACGAGQTKGICDGHPDRYRRLWWLDIQDKGKQESPVSRLVFQEILSRFLAWFPRLCLWGLHGVWKCGTISPNFQYGDSGTMVHDPAVTRAGHLASDQTLEKINCIAKKGRESSIKQNKQRLLVPCDSAGLGDSGGAGPLSARRHHLWFPTQALFMSLELYE